MNENKLTKHELLYEQLKPEILKLLSSASAFCILSLDFHILDGQVKRTILKREESIVPRSIYEHPKGTNLPEQYQSDRTGGKK